MNITDLSDDSLRHLIKTLARQVESDKIIYFHPTDAFGNFQNGGVPYVFTRREVTDEGVRRVLLYE